MKQIFLLALLVCVAAAQEGALRKEVESSQGFPDLIVEITAVGDDHTAGKLAAAGCPVSCFRADPVCGLNGVTYWCGSKDAECDGVGVAHAGYCNPGNGGVGGKGVMAGQALLLVHLVWLMLAGVLVVLGLP